MLYARCAQAENFYKVGLMIFLLFLALSGIRGCRGASVEQSFLKDIIKHTLDLDLPQDLPNVTESGYLQLGNNTDSAIFYNYYTAQNPKGSGAPIIVWLQVRCNKICSQPAICACSVFLVICCSARSAF